MERQRKAKAVQSQDPPCDSARVKWMRTVAGAKLLLFLGAGTLIFVGCGEPDRIIGGRDSFKSHVVSRERRALVPEVRDLTKGGCPARLLAQAKAVAKGHVTRVHDSRRYWSSVRLFTFWTDRGKYLKFMPRGDTYVQVNAPSGSGAINDFL